MKKTPISHLSRRQRVLVAFGILAVVLVLGTQVISAVTPRTDKFRIARAESKALATNKADTDDRIHLLAQHGINGSEVARTVVNSCYIDQDDGGFFTIRFNQKCYLQTTVGMQVKDLPNAGVVDAFPDGWIPGSDDCEVAIEMSENTTSVVATRPQQPNCAAPDPAKPNLNVVAYAVEDVKSQTLSKAGENYNPSQPMIWVTHSTSYWDEDLGCKKPKIIFCNSPRSTPTMP